MYLIDSTLGHNEQARVHPNGNLASARVSQALWIPTYLLLNASGWPECYLKDVLALPPTEHIWDIISFWYSHLFRKDTQRLPEGDNRHLKNPAFVQVDLATASILHREFNYKVTQLGVETFIPMQKYSLQNDPWKAQPPLLPAQGSACSPGL